MEAKVCNVLKFNLNYRTPHHYVDRFLMASLVSSDGSVVMPRVGGQSLVSCMLSRTNNPLNDTLKRLVFYLLDLAVLDYKLVTKRPGLICAGAVYLARATLGIREPPTTNESHCSSNQLFNSPTSSSLARSAKGYWSKTLEYYTGYDIWDLEETVRILHRLHECAESGSGNVSSLGSTEANCVYKKHKSVKFGRVALKIVANEEELGFL